jgi:ATP adenylyltransferase
MEHLWAPWRNQYITTQAGKGHNPFSEIAASTDDARNFVLWRSKASFAVLNSFPYNTGHTLVLPCREVANFEDLSEEETQDLWQTVLRIKRALTTAFAPQAFNLGANLGEGAGAGIPMHLHFHIVPRWKNDANFMTTIGDTRVHPSDLAQVYEKLRAVLVEG